MKNYSIVGGVMEHPVTDGIMVDTTITADAYAAAAMITGAVRVIMEYDLSHVGTCGWSVFVEVEGDGGVYTPLVYIYNHGDEIHIEDATSHIDYGWIESYEKLNEFLVGCFETL